MLANCFSKNRFLIYQETADLPAFPLLQMGAGGNYPRRDRMVKPQPPNDLPSHPLIKLQSMADGEFPLPLCGYSASPDHLLQLPVAKAPLAFRCPLLRFSLLV